MIIGICGPAGSGKSTVAKYLRDHYDVMPLAFADDLKVLVMDAFELQHEQVYGTQEQKETIDHRYNQSGRNFMTRVGEAAKRVWGNDFWVKRTLEEARTLQARYSHVVIEDVRFPVEAQAILREGGFVWRLNSQWAKSQADKTHASETSWKLCSCTHTIEPAEYGLESLYAEVDRLAAEVKLEPWTGSGQ